MFLFQLYFLCGLKAFCVFGVLALTEISSLSYVQIKLNFFNESTYVSLTSSHSLLEERILNFIQTVKSGQILKTLSYLWFTIVSCQITIQFKSSVVFLKIFYLLIFRERGREGEKHECVVASPTPPTGDMACNPGMCPDWEWEGWPFGLQAGTQSTEPHQPGLKSGVFIVSHCLG